MKKTIKKKKIDLRVLILSIISAILLITIGYKYYEWNTINELSKQFNSSWKQEFKIVESSSPKSDDFWKLFRQVFDSNYSPEIFLKNYGDLTGKLNLRIQNEDEYRNLISDNLAQYKTLQSKISFLAGSRGDIAKQIINYQIEYYGNELENANSNEASMYFEADLLSLWSDKAKSDILNAKVSPDPKKDLPLYFSDIASLQTYTYNDFKFDHEDSIKKYFSNGYEALTKYKDFLANTYRTVQNIVNGDIDSATYNYSSLTSNISDLTLNFNGIFSVGKDQGIQRGQNIIKEVSNQALLIKQFKKNGFGKYPFLPTISIWKEDLVLCQTYDYKTGLYNLITSKYPTSKNVDDLLKELSNINPKTDSIDKDFDKSVVTYINDDKKIEFQCKDKVDGDTLTFTITKPEVAKTN